jgi:outer membrane receptor protein involved in Fe transport
MPTFLRNFGVQANYTYLDAKTEFFNPVTKQFESGRIVLPNAPIDQGGISKHTYNLTGMYEGGGFSARLSYNKRSSYLDTRDFRGDPNNPGDFFNDLYLEEARPAGRLDLSMNYAFNENMTIFFDWTNILEDPFRVDFSSARQGAPRAEYVRFLRYEETTFSLGARFRL